MAHTTAEDYPWEHTHPISAAALLAWIGGMLPSSARDARLIEDTAIRGYTLPTRRVPALTLGRVGDRITWRVATDSHRPVSNRRC